MTIKKFRDSLISLELGMNELGVNERFQLGDVVTKTCPFCPSVLEDELRPLYRCPDYNEVQNKYLRPVVDNDVEPSLKYVFNNPNIYANRKALCVHVLYVIFMTIQCEIIKNTQNDVHRPSNHQ